ncbi:RNA polymerase sigma factor SigJ [Nocardioides aequoreus]|uniref:RNA polymerase sigma factor SigJ n=1 Tax=Nocardioides aequoreus TaxID=397278 RepID=UPI0004C2BBFF|nr:RNA polymerase sigma factor SigJ [Nocardioides aequoreus]
MSDPTAVFAELRPTLMGAAYRILSSRTDAEDVVQDAWLRWRDVDHDEVVEPRAYLLTITSRLALNRLRTLARLREAYVGPWLPEPVADASADGAAVAELADDVSMAMLVVLESLGPLERAAFVLTEVFAMPAADVGAALDRSPAAVRQLVHRAREHVAARRPRQQVDREGHRVVVERFLAAARGGDLDALVGLLAPDVVLVSDGGGVRSAARHPIHGASKVLRFLTGLMATPTGREATMRAERVNGETALVVRSPDGLEGVWFAAVDGGRITAVYGVRNPEKLGAV